MTHRKAPIEVLEALAEDQVAIYKDLPDGHEFLPANVAAYRAATAPLRTRAEVDAEIARTVRTIGSRGGPHMPAELAPTTADLQHMVTLRDEPTRDEPET